jgi:hypothetical protein
MENPFHSFPLNDAFYRELASGSADFFKKAPIEPKPPETMSQTDVANQEIGV